MVIMFIVVVSVYCMMALLVHVYHSYSQFKQQSKKHYVLHSENDIDILEWYYHCFRRFSKTMDVNVSITVVGYSTSNYAISLIERWQKQDDLICYVSDYEAANQDDIHIYMNNTSDLKKLPF